jgi:hypothetical protein
VSVFECALSALPTPNIREHRNAQRSPIRPYSTPSQTVVVRYLDLPPSPIVELALCLALKLRASLIRERDEKDSGRARETVGHYARDPNG